MGHYASEIDENLMKLNQRWLTVQNTPNGDICLIIWEKEGSHVAEINIPHNSGYALRDAIKFVTEQGAVAHIDISIKGKRNDNVQ